MFLSEEWLPVGHETCDSAKHIAPRIWPARAAYAPLVHKQNEPLRSSQAVSPTGLRVAMQTLMQ